MTITNSQRRAVRQLSAWRRRTGRPRGVAAGQARLPGYVVALLYVVPAVVLMFALSSDLLFQLSLLAIYLVAAIGLNVAIGYGGQLFLGQVAIMGLAAYATGLLSTRSHLSPWETLVPALALGTALGLLIGFVALRLTSLYLGMVSFFLVIVLPDVVNSFPGVTGGDNGLIGIPSLYDTFTRTGTMSMYATTVAFMIATIMGVRALLLSGWGVRLKALRDSPEALSTCGLSPTVTRMTVYFVTSLLASLAGWELTFLNGYVSAELFGVDLTLLLLAGVVVGGQGTIVGPVIGTAIVEGYSHLVGQYSTYNTVGLGVVLVIVVILFPNGVAEIVEAVAARLRTRRRAAQSAAPPPAPPAPVEAEEAPPPTGRAGRAGGRSAPAVLAIHQLSKAFDGVVAVSDVDIELHTHQVLGLVGANGSGKTTVVNLVTGIYRSDAGRIVLNGHDLIGQPPHQIAQLGIARTFQVPQLIPRASVRENIELGLLANHTQPGWQPVLLPWRAARTDRIRRAHADAVLDALAIPVPLRSLPVAALPLGMKRVLELGRAIATGATLLCLDEPAAGLNEEELDRLAEVIADLRTAGKGVLIIEHNRRFVTTVADAALFMVAGQITDQAQLGNGEVPEFLRGLALPVDVGPPPSEVKADA